MKNIDEIGVKDVMRSNVAMVDGTISVMQALRIMKEVGGTSLIVKKRFPHDEYGMVLFSDIAKQVIATNRAPERVNAYEIMAKPVISVRPDMNIRYCARLFERFGISHAPVIENDQVIGIVSYYLLVLGIIDLG
ncbi:MAG: CBS domain-containing protein [Gammaproteobacteria bacterium]|nr:CBS domain-containing protein [Gammaproteobacteria bacterium]MDH4313939.1 CBS domain-containing protein [Gammaproteobacteria bacterium]MDH5212985.1 CBS domain-containing protein [Gammaproteobacteria bacterium]MDH5502174.1 CBS domain-containing protein [Gammaproteobacteria bacterium]